MRMLLSSWLVLMASTGFAQESVRVNSDVRQGAREASSKQTLMPTSKLIGEAIKYVDGEECGEINSFVIDPRGQVAYVIIGHGGVLGIGDDEVAVPWAAFQCKCTMEDEKMRCHPSIKMAGKQMEAAAKLKAKNYKELSDDGWARKNAAFFRVDESLEPLDAAAMLCTSDLINANLATVDDKSVGILDDLVIQNGSGKVLYAIAGIGGVAGVGKSYVALPFGALSFDKAHEKLQVTVDRSKAQFEASEKVTPNEYPELKLSSVANRINEISR